MSTEINMPLITTTLKQPTVSFTWLEQCYGFHIDSITCFGNCSGNSNYLLRSDEGSYVISIIEEQSLAEVDKMAELLNWLEFYGYTTSRLKPRLDGGKLSLVNGKPAIMRTYLDGETKSIITNSQAFQIGRALAELHQLPLPGFLPQAPYYEQPQFKQVLNLNLDHAYESWLKYQISQYASIRHTRLPRCLIHADVFNDNVLFAGEQLVALIDFELACNYDRIYDLAMAMVGTCVANGRVCWPLATHLLRGYEVITKLISVEKETLPEACVYAATLTSQWRYWRYRWREPSHHRANSYEEMVLVAKQFCEVKSRLKLLASV